MRLKEVRIARRKTQKQLADEAGIEETVLSRIENYACLPTPDKLTAICDKLECSKTDIYDVEEIDLLGKLNKAVKGKKLVNEKVYRLTVSLDRKALQVLNRYVLNEFGYSSVTDFVRRSVDRLVRRYEKKVAHTLNVRTTPKDE